MCSPRACFLVVVVVVAVAGCGSPSTPTSSGQLQIPVADPGHLSCGGGAPLLCPDGCCGSGDACGISGCDLPAATPSCPPASPLYCATTRTADSSGSGNPLTLAAPADFVLGHFGGGVSVECAQNSSCPPNITGAVIALPSAAPGVTIEAWVRPTVLEGSLSVITVDNFLLALSPSAAVPPLDDAWHFVAATFTSPSVPPSFYLDGVALTGAQSGLSAGSITGTGTGSPGVIIGDNPDGSLPFFGAIDEVRVLGVVAAPSAIAADFAGGPLTAIAGTVALWHFDDGASGWCCATGSTCGADAGDCAAPTAGVAGCMGSTPVQCPSGCCPAGSTCDASGSCNVGIAGCPASAPVDCGDGTCCGAGYTCAPSGCVLNPPTPAPSPACPTGTSPATNSTTECCPSSQSAVYCGGYCVPGATCGTVACTTTCTNGYGCVCQKPNPCTPCEGLASPTLCASLCGGNCCGAGETCSSGKCCPAGTSPCGGACCSTSQCSAGACTTAKTPTSCPADTTACGGSCCPGGALCVNGACLTVPVPGTYCTRGFACAGQCCLGASCSPTGECVQIVVPPFSPCPAGCYGGRAASVGGGRSGPLVCHCNIKSPATPSCTVSGFPIACGPTCCAAGGSCTQGRCNCPADHPIDCGANCCIAGGACVNGSCACPEFEVACGGRCCGAGQTCVNGACQTMGSTTGSVGGCDSFGQQNCNPTNGARCYNGHCQSCWSTCGSGTGVCSCNGCDSTCTGSGYVCASDGTCLFPPPPTGPACSN